MARQKLVTDIEVNADGATADLKKLGKAADGAAVDVDQLARELKSSERSMKDAGDSATRSGDRISDAYDNTQDSALGAASAVGEAFGQGGTASDAVGSFGEVVESLAESFGPFGAVAALVGGAVVGMFQQSKAAAEAAKQAALDFRDALLEGGGALEKANMAKRTADWFAANQDLVDSVERLAGPQGLQLLHESINGNTAAASELTKMLGAQNQMDEQIIKTTDQKIIAGQELTKEEKWARDVAQQRIATYKELEPELRKQTDAAREGARTMEQLAVATDRAGKYAAQYKAPSISVKPGQVVTLPARAAGGPVEAGHAYTVGEYGKETFVPATDGTIVPGTPGGTIAELHVHLHAPVMTPAVVREAAPVIGRAISDAQRRGGQPAVRTVYKGVRA